MNSDSFNLGLLARYFVSGLTAITILYVVPCSMGGGRSLAIVFTGGGAIAGLGLSIVVGYLLDCVKLYRLQFSDIVPTLYQKSYLARKKRFMTRFATALGIPSETDQAMVYHSLLTQLSPREIGFDLRRKHSEWTLMENTVRVFAGLILIWGYEMVYSFVRLDQQSYLKYFVLLVLTILLDVRLSKSADNERRKLDAIYIEVASQNKASELKKLFVARN